MGLKQADTFQHASYPGITITTMQDEDGKISFTIKGENLDHVRIVEEQMLEAVTNAGGSISKRTERTEG
ncbi:MAG TPA: hypothetical protein VFN49_03655 [Candidatus Aquilonibacter sp.]|nr:hypothetical protein [Candidatus Aquilonibacter sp.]